MESSGILKTIEICYRVTNLHDLSSKHRDLYMEVRKEVGKAYAPYSNFGVCAGILLGDGRMLVGTNQENASYPVGICAERVVLSAWSVGNSSPKIQAMLILTEKLTSPDANMGFDFKIDPDLPVAPCGMCRQAMAEQVFRQKGDFELLLVSSSGRVWIFDKAMALLPMAFGDI